MIQPVPPQPDQGKFTRNAETVQTQSPQEMDRTSDTEQRTWNRVQKEMRNVKSWASSNSQNMGGT